MIPASKEALKRNKIYGIHKLNVVFGQCLISLKESIWINQKLTSLVIVLVSTIRNYSHERK